jgi:flagellar basal body rod protein FlgG
MNYGLYLSASGVLTNSYRQDVLANNLANVNTVAFKPDLPTIQARPPESVEDLTAFGTSHDLLEQLGGGVLAGPQHTRFSTGPIEQTGRDLDIALEESNQFLAVRTVDPQTGTESVRLTRDGRLAVSGEGYLTTTAGHRLLNPADQPIPVAPNAEVTIADDGRVMQNGAAVGQLQVATVTNTAALEKAGANLFAFAGAPGNPGNDPRTDTATPQLRVGALESSATNAITTMMAIMASSKAASGNARLIQYHDTLMDRAINTFGRVA